MKVKDIIVKALTFIGRGDTASRLSGGESLTDEEGEAVETMLFCFNAVEDEVARNYLKLTYKEQLTGRLGHFPYAYFMHTPLEVLKVEVDGAEVSFEMFPTFLYADSDRVTAEYTFAPTKKTIDDSADFPDTTGENVFAFGAASEYCLINGEVESAEVWETKYRQTIDALQSGAEEEQKLPHGGYIPPRRWV